MADRTMSQERVYSDKETEALIGLIALATYPGFCSPVCNTECPKCNLRMEEGREAIREVVHANEGPYLTTKTDILDHLKARREREQDSEMFVEAGAVSDNDAVDTLQPELDENDNMEVEQQQTLRDTQPQRAHQEENPQEDQEEERQWEARARIQEQEKIRADLRARIAFQERGSGLRVANFSSTRGHQGRSNHHDREGEAPSRIAHEHINTSVEVSISIADDTTISDADSDDGTAVCSICRFNTNVVRLEPCPTCVLNDMKELGRKRRRNTEEEEEKQSPKKAARGKERPTMPRTTLDDLHRGRNRSRTLGDELAPPQVRPKLPISNQGLTPRAREPSDFFARSNAVRSRAGPSYPHSTPPRTKTQKPDRSKMLEVLRAARNKKRGTGSSGRVNDPKQEIPSFLAPSPTAGILGRPWAQLRGQARPSIRAPTSEEATFEPGAVPRPSQNRDQLENVTQRARRASIDLALVARVVATADTAAKEETSTPAQLDGSVTASEATRLDIFLELLAGAGPEQPAAASNHGFPNHTLDENTNEESSSDEEDWHSEASSKPYDQAPSFDPTIGNEQFLKQLARMEYAMVENIPELEDSDNDVPDEHNPGKTRRRITQTPEDDYPVPIDGGDMRLRPEQHVYCGKISGKLKSQTPDEYLDDRTATLWHLEIARCKERHVAILVARERAGSNGAAVVGRSPATNQGD